MLRELLSTQARGERRRWFADEHFDLIVWLAADGSVDGFQLCYDGTHSEHALTWDRRRGYKHDRVDDGESSPTQNRTPILIADGQFQANDVVSRFEESCAQIDASIRGFVVEKMRAYAAARTKGELP